MLPINLSQSFLFLVSGLGFWIFSCTNAPTPAPVKTEQQETIIQEEPIQKKTTITDSRDGAVYKIITIGKQTWFAENLRYDAPGSMLNPDNPSVSYGRLYTLTAAQGACPKGWHTATDWEWNQLELAHGMPAADTLRGGWRGTHGTHMKSKKDWGDNNIITDSLGMVPFTENGNGTDQLGFKVLPAGYYFSGKMGGEEGMQGLGYSAGFWSSVENNVGCARFLFSPRKWVNKWEDKNDETGAGLSCRCVKD